MGKKKGGKQVVVEQDLESFTAQQDRIAEEKKQKDSGQAAKNELPAMQQAYIKAQEHAVDSSDIPFLYYLDNKMIESLTQPISD